MFTGIVEELGRIEKVSHEGDSYNLDISARKVLDGTRLGDSISVNGVCLTVSSMKDSIFTVGLAPETLSRTNLGSFARGEAVNLERSLTPASRMGGHIVQGHVDGTGEVTAFKKDGSSLWVHVRTSPDLMRYIVPKGFVALDGVSLTVVETSEDAFSVMLVEYTQAHITLATQRAGYRVNIETDILGKYIENLISRGMKSTKSRNGLSLAFLADNGYL